MKIKCYTLVEILMVVGIIAILVGLAIPVLNSARATAKLNKAAAECNSIALAIKNFESEYGQMPNPTSTGAPTGNLKDEGDSGSAQNLYSPTENAYPTQSTTLTQGYKNFFSMLTGYQYSNKDNKKTEAGSGNEQFHNNTKKITFLDPPASYVKKGTSLDPKTEGFLDPWGKPYTIIYRTNGDTASSFYLYQENGTNKDDVKMTLLAPVAVYTIEGNAKTSKPALGTSTFRYATSWNGVISRQEK